MTTESKTISIWDERAGYHGPAHWSVTCDVCGTIAGGGQEGVAEPVWPDRDEAREIADEHMRTMHGDWVGTELPDTQGPLYEEPPRPHLPYAVSIAEIIAEYRPGPGRHWFDAETMRFFGTHLPVVGYRLPGNAGCLFVTSEQFVASNGEKAPRRYSVRRFDGSRIETLGPFNKMSRSEAYRALRDAWVKAADSIPPQGAVPG